MKIAVLYYPPGESIVAGERVDNAVLAGRMLEAARTDPEFALPRELGFGTPHWELRTIEVDGLCAYPAELDGRKEGA